MTTTTTTSSELEDRKDWHALSILIPFPTPSQAHLVQRVIQVDKPLRPSEVTRNLTVNEQDSTLFIEFRARTIAQARVALDHCLSDVQLIVQTMHKFGPKEMGGAVKKQEGGEGGSETIEVGLMGSWEGVKR